MIEEDEKVKISFQKQLASTNQLNSSGLRK